MASQRVGVIVNHAKVSGEPQDIFTREVFIKGDLDDAQQDRLIEIANKCPVHRTLERGSAVETRKSSPKATAMLSSFPEQHFRDMEQACED